MNEIPFKILSEIRAARVEQLLQEQEAIAKA
jgi:hypothetical protein